jgi:hypothetical protein
LRCAGRPFWVLVICFVCLLDNNLSAGHDTIPDITADGQVARQRVIGVGRGAALALFVGLLRRPGWRMANPGRDASEESLSQNGVSR